MMLKLVAILAVFVAIADGDDSKTVRDFAENFKQAMQDRSDVFKTTGVNDKTWGDEFYRQVYSQTKGADENRADEVAKLGEKAILANFATLPQNSFLVTYANSMARVLQVLGLLNDPKKLSDEYAESFHESINKYYKPNKSVSKVETLVHGFVDYTNQKKLTSKQNLPVFGVLFAKALYDPK